MQSENSEEASSDAPPHVLRGNAAKEAQGDQTFVGKTVTIGKPRQEIYDIWKDFTRFPSFMENVRQVEPIDESRSEWLIKGRPGAT
ncbi:SRPBCC family protein [Sphingomonas daechungensis]|uniref:SRPBCC family protein n=1 Tax=Sphingomonas daechungensis TaxID=1176646 RepID=UPI001CB95DB8|nr:SRPBCC family protein [Sphingomonas daechungensis]